ncbi:hypothetical protein D3C87_1918320 [compost metagenome]
MHLPLLAAVVATGQGGDDLVGRVAFAQQRQAVRAVERADEGLRGDRANAPADMRDQTADRKEASSDGDAEITSLGITSDDGPSHAYLPIA